ncbi:hypothetical protein H17ap60334_04917 [Thermosipho africanus H17ap60334]|uniref:hypothetical protein n=1 Tax=Thermosipho africanus TaxID=2421 RepID=UPI00028ED5A6|nr:hypothetical protein [Thermosipho africanus]EKF49525.1 hypothetical protein H17ap60334_04917 [Thermosipho africanus H17ap60334]
MADVMKDRVWKNVPPAGSSKREDMPSHVFLDPVNKRYPFKKYVDGRWKVSCAGLLAAYRRATMNKDNDIVNKAKSLAQKYKCSWANKE